MFDLTKIWGQVSKVLKVPKVLKVAKNQPHIVVRLIVVKVVYFKDAR